MHRFLSKVLNTMYVSVAYKQLDEAMLQLLIAVNNDITNALKIKYEHMKSSGRSVEEIKSIKKVDDAAVGEWRDAAIAKVIISLPDTFYKFVEYSNWSEAEAVFYERKRKEYE